MTTKHQIRQRTNHAVKLLGGILDSRDEAVDLRDRLQREPAARYLSSMNIFDGICSEGFILDGLYDWPWQETREEWFRITRELVARTIADMDLDPTVGAEVIEAFTGAGLL